MFSNFSDTLHSKKEKIHFQCQGKQDLNKIKNAKKLEQQYKQILLEKTFLWTCQNVSFLLHFWVSKTDSILLSFNAKTVFFLVQCLNICKAYVRPIKYRFKEQKNLPFRFKCIKKIRNFFHRNKKFRTCLINFNNGYLMKQLLIYN